MHVVLPPELVAVIVKLVVGNSTVGTPVNTPVVESIVIPSGRAGLILNLSIVPE